MDCATIAQSALHLVWPSICAHCREDLAQGDEGPLCLGCRLKLQPCEPPYCERCCEPLRPPRTHCARCAASLHACGLVRAAYRYREAAVSVVHAFKYRGRRSAARAAGRWMAAALARLPELGRPDALVPMPLHPRRRRERGYNQAQLIAEGLAEAADLPLLDLLSRTRPTRPQWSLGLGERRANLSGAFTCARPDAAAGRRLLLVDDVCTSGASLEGCAEALREAGALRVDGFVFARQHNPLR